GRRLGLVRAHERPAAPAPCGPRRGGGVMRHGLAAAVVAAWLPLVAAGPAAAAPAAGVDRSPEHVVLVDWGGSDPALLDRAEAPNLDRPAERGSEPLIAARGSAPASAAFSASSGGEALLDVTVASPGVDWSTVGAESAVASLAVDGRPVGDLVVPAEGPLRRHVALGPVTPGRHSVEVAFSDAASSPAARELVLTDVSVEVVPAGEERHLALRHAPVLLGRSIAVANSEGPGTSYAGPLQNAVTDTPLVAWHEVAAGPDGRRTLEYSVVWSNEDGGTDSPALMARWGRTTDIEWVYRVDVDGAGDALPGTAAYQGPDHATVPFAGTFEGDHPVLQTCTANNMVCDEVADTGMRFLLAADATRPPERAREVLMDANPWTYRVMAAEMVREGRIESPSDPSTRAVGDQRSYLYLELDKETVPPNLPAEPWVGVAVEVHLAEGGALRSDHGIADLSIERDVAAATTVELPPGTTADDVAAVVAVRVPVGTIDTGAAVRVTALHRAFLLDGRYLPQPSLPAWSGQLTLTRSNPTAILWSR
ncbi:MAG TPA: hypothetical protein VFW63_06055, partial [Acidimicrobiales bacterium]|nr:hypothetical protein [Acidimicrobiales bacterium]